MDTTTKEGVRYFFYLLCILLIESLQIHDLVVMAQECVLEISMVKLNILIKRCDLSLHLLLLDDLRGMRTTYKVSKANRKGLDAKAIIFVLV